METKGIGAGPKPIAQEDLNKNQSKPKKAAEQSFEQSEAASFNVGASADIAQFIGGTDAQRSETKSLEIEAELKKKIDIAV